VRGHLGFSMEYGRGFEYALLVFKAIAITFDDNLLINLDPMY